MYVQDSMNLSPELAQAVESRVNQVLRGRGLRSICVGKGTSGMTRGERHLDGPASGTANQVGTAGVHEVRWECDVSLALACLSRHFRALNSPTGIHSKVNQQMGVDDAAAEGEQAVQEPCADVVTPTAEVPPSGRQGMSNDGIVFSNGLPAVSRRGLSGSGEFPGQPGPLSSLQRQDTEQQWAAGVATLLVKALNRNEAAAGCGDSQSGESRSCAVIAGCGDAGHAAVNKAPSWDFATQCASRPCRKMTRSGMCSSEWKCRLL